VHKVEKLNLSVMLRRACLCHSMLSVCPWRWGTVEYFKN